MSPRRRIRLLPVDDGHRTLQFTCESVIQKKARTSDEVRALESTKLWGESQSAFATCTAAAPVGRLAAVLAATEAFSARSA